MANSQLSGVVRYLRSAAVLGHAAELTDGQLLGRFVCGREEAALATLVRRHSPMVWGVCRRILGNHHDAEDAFQGTFLVFVRKAASIASRELLANWLYGVAHQTALNARASAAKRSTRERQVKELPETKAVRQKRWYDLQPLLDQELSRLPEKYRVAIVLCELEGKTRKEAARQIGCPEGTLAARLSRGRVMLAKRLARHGLVVSGASLAATLAQNGASAAMPISMVSNTIQAATLVAAGQATAGLLSAKAVVLAEGILKAMLLTKLKIAAVLLLAAACAATSGAIILAPEARAMAQAEEKQTGLPKKAEEPMGEKAQGKPMLSSDDLRGKWMGEKNGVKVGLTISGERARWQHWDVTYSTPSVGVSKSADLKCVADAKGECLNLYLPAYLGDNKEIMQIDALNGRAPVGQIRRGPGGTIQLRIIPTGYEKLADATYDYPAVEDLILRRDAEAPR